MPSELRNRDFFRDAIFVTFIITFVYQVSFRHNYERGLGIILGLKPILQVGKSSIKFMRGNISIAHASDSAPVHPYPAITLCPSWTHDRKDMDTDNLTADYNLLRPIDQLVFSVEYSYQDDNR